MSFICQGLALLCSRIGSVLQYIDIELFVASESCADTHAAGILNKIPKYMENLRYCSVTGDLPYKWMDVAAFGQLKSLRSFELKSEHRKEWCTFKEFRLLDFLGFR